MQLLIVLDCENEREVSLAEAVADGYASLTYDMEIAYELMMIDNSQVEAHRDIIGQLLD